MGIVSSVLQFFRLAYPRIVSAYDETYTSNSESFALEGEMWAEYMRNVCHRVM